MLSKEEIYEQVTVSTACYKGGGKNRVNGLKMLFILGLCV